MTIDNHGSGYLGMARYSNVLCYSVYIINDFIVYLCQNTVLKQCTKTAFCSEPHPFMKQCADSYHENITTKSLIC